MQQEELLRKELLAEIESIAPVVAEHAAASEALGRLDEPTMAALRSTRLLRLYSPRELGGLEADPVTQLIVLEALARIDASTSWTLGILAGVPGYLEPICRLLRRGGSSLTGSPRWPVHCCPRAPRNRFRAAIESRDGGPMGAVSIMPNG